MRADYIDWRGLYSESWKGDIVAEAMSHPAKFARGLIRHIYDHALEEGWLKAGDHVLDPFGGVALGAPDAMRHGLFWTGVELENPFYELGLKNIEFWNNKYGDHLPGQAVLVNGDSRNLRQILESKFDSAISSPPFRHTEGGTNAAGGLIDEAMMRRHSASNLNAEGYGGTDGQLANMKEGDFDATISSPPFMDNNVDIGAVGDTPAKRQQIHDSEKRDKSYGETDGQLGNMPTEGFDAALSSPPYAEARIDGRGDEGASGLRMPDGSYPRGEEGWKLRKELGDRYGSTEGNLGNLKDEGFDASVSSPPFEKSNPDGGWQMLGKYAEEGRLTVKQVGGDPTKSYPSWDKDRDTSYAQSDENLGSQEGETFWSAARKIVDGVYSVLRPGGVAIWVCKAYVKNGERVDFPGMWMRLCESAGFKLVHWHRAWVVEELGAQYDLFGNLVEQKKERKSFFRRLAEKKGAPPIDWEDVICMIKET